MVCISFGKIIKSKITVLIVDESTIVGFILVVVFVLVILAMGIGFKYLIFDLFEITRGEINPFEN